MPDDRLHSTWLHSDRFIPARFLRPVLRFTRVEAAGGLVLLLAAVAALVWANLPSTDSYERFWESSVDIRIGAGALHETLRGLVNDGLMTIFFFVVGLEIKRELVHGELQDPKTAALPVLAAVGGMVIPAAIYLAFAAGIGAAHGWAVPVATDIAFSLGVLALLGNRVPVGARLFLLTLAIADDIGGIVVIALAYTEQVRVWWLLGSIATLVAVWAAGRVKVRALTFYCLAAFAAWFCLLESGVHATLSGVALAFLTPAAALYGDEQYRDRTRRILGRYETDAAAPHGDERIDQAALALAAVARESVSPLDRLDRALHPWSSFAVVPIFALANAGVRFAGIDLAEAATHPVTLGLLAGKVIGITGFTWLAVRLGWGRLPRATGWRQVVGLAAVARESVSPLDRLDRALHPWSSFAVVPIFALANAGVRFAGIDLAEAATHPVTLGVALGLLAGKVIGITGFTWLAVRLGWGRLPRATGWRHVVGLAAVAGIGFTVALFIAGLAFTDPLLADQAKLGIFAGSLLAGLLGYVVLRLTPPEGGQDTAEDA
ncbi:MAG: Na+/H+ antiporter NhaA [Actinobacteria bacterium RBG_16_70_17]|nr:MAG: Na+/H+ antiporter NhaA [Actinobacteria bacterium RBG_16_70_17]